MSKQIELQVNGCKNLPKIVLEQTTRNMVYRTYLRWQTDKDCNGKEVWAFDMYADFIEFDIMQDEDIETCKATKDPFGFKFETKEGKNYHFFLVVNGSEVEAHVKATD